MRHLLRLLALPALLLALPAAAHDGVLVADPYARILSGNGVVYLRVDNHQDHPDALIAARTDIGQAMLMTSGEDANGVMRMAMAPDGFDIEAASTLFLAPAGRHIMLSDLSRQPRPGETFFLTLTFRDAGEVTLSVPVDNTRRDGPGIEPTPHDMLSGDAH